MPDETDEIEVSLEAVSKDYSLGRQRIAALSDVTLQIPSGRVATIVGPSGSGKSTLLHLIAGLDTPTSGHVTVSGENLGRLTDDHRSDLRLERIGFVFQAFNLFPTFTVEENVGLPLELLGMQRKVVRDRARAALASVGIDRALASRKPAELSGGEQQRTAIARALVAEPRLIIADEPTGNLDSITGAKILDLLRELNVTQGRTIILVTHSETAAAYGHETIELRDGRVVRR